MSKFIIASDDESIKIILRIQIRFFIIDIIDMVRFFLIYFIGTVGVFLQNKIDVIGMIHNL